MYGDGKPPVDNSQQLSAESKDQVPQAQAPGLFLKSSPKTETIANAAALVLAVFLVIAAVSIVWVWNQSVIVTCNCELPSMKVIQGEIDGNWTLTVDSISSNQLLEPRHVTMSIFDRNGTWKLPMHAVRLSTLTPDNWTIYRVAFQKVNSGSNVGHGDVIFVDKASYPSGFRYELYTTIGVIARGTF